MIQTIQNSSPTDSSDEFSPDRALSGLNHKLPRSGRAVYRALPEWLFEYDLAASASPTAGNDEKFILYESFRAGGKRHVCWPDAAVRIRLGEKQNYELLAYIEYDRSTEGQRQIAAKGEPYQLLVDERRYERHWRLPMSNPLVRVLFIARSEGRIRHLTEALRETRAANLFRFTTYADLVPETLLTEAVWRTIGGQFLCVLRQGAPGKGYPHVEQ